MAARVGASSVALFRPPPTVGSSPSPSKDPPRSTASARVPAVKPAGGACVPEALAAGVPQDESRLAGRRKKGVTMVDGWIVGVEGATGELGGAPQGVWVDRCSLQPRSLGPGPWYCAP